MKPLTSRKKNTVRKYEPRKEDIQRVQEEILALSRAITM